jgi:hypothetical protein
VPKTRKLRARQTRPQSGCGGHITRRRHRWASCRKVWAATSRMLRPTSPWAAARRMCPGRKVSRGRESSLVRGEPNPQLLASLRVQKPAQWARPASGCSLWRQNRHLTCVAKVHRGAPANPRGSRASRGCALRDWRAGEGSLREVLRPVSLGWRSKAETPPPASLALGSFL